MNEAEAERFIQTVEQGLRESHIKMLKEKALHNQTVVIADKQGNIVKVPASELLKQYD